MTVMHKDYKKEKHSAKYSMKLTCSMRSDTTDTSPVATEIRHQSVVKHIKNANISHM